MKVRWEDEGGKMKVGNAEHRVADHAQPFSAKCVTPFGL